MDQYRRLECGKILQNHVGQLFLICQTCHFECLSIESFTQHQTAAHGRQQVPESQQPPGTSVKGKNRPIGIGRTNVYKAVPNRTSATQVQSSVGRVGISQSSAKNEETILSGKYKCGNCLQKFNTLVDLDSHKHGNCQPKKEMKCDYCPKTVETITGLRSHIRVHHESHLPFPCSICPRSFNQRLELTIHKRKHANNAVSLCDFCEQEFRSEYEKRNHMKRFHPFAKFQCTNCLYECKYEAGLRRHQQIVHEFVTN